MWLQISRLIVCLVAFQQDSPKQQFFHRLLNENANFDEKIKLNFHEISINTKEKYSWREFFFFVHREFIFIHQVQRMIYFLPLVAPFTTNFNSFFSHFYKNTRFLSADARKKLREKESFVTWSLKNADNSKVQSRNRRGSRASSSALKFIIIFICRDFCGVDTRNNFFCIFFYVSRLFGSRNIENCFKTLLKACCFWSLRNFSYWKFPILLWTWKMHSVFGMSLSYHEL